MKGFLSGLAKIGSETAQYWKAETHESLRTNMNALQGTVKNGQVLFDDPAPLPDGTRVEVLPINGNHCSLGMREEDWPSTPEAIAALLARIDQVQPGWLSPEDDAAWRADLGAQKEREKAKFLEDAAKLRDIWE
jgi:hypothetical protein